MRLTKAFLRAVDDGDIETVRRMLGETPELARCRGDHDVTPLHAAVERDRAEMTELLIEFGADLEATTTWGMTPLAWAANMGSGMAARILIAKGARLNIWSAAGLGLLDQVRSFVIAPGELAEGAAQASYLQLLDGDWEALPPPKSFVNAISDAFYVACRNGHPEVARYLLGEGAEIDYRGFFGGTGLHWAAMNGHREMVEFLLESGADRNLPDEQFETTPAGWARECGHDEIAAILE